MLATQKKQPPSWPVLKPSPSTSEPVKLINVTGSKMKMASNVQAHNDSDVEPEGYEPVPAYNRSFSDAITQALQMVEERTEDDGKLFGMRVFFRMLDWMNFVLFLARF